MLAKVMPILNGKNIRRRLRCDAMRSARSAEYRSLIMVPEQALLGVSRLSRYRTLRPTPGTAQCQLKERASPENPLT